MGRHRRERLGQGGRGGYEQAKKALRMKREEVVAQAKVEPPVDGFVGDAGDKGAGVTGTGTIDECDETNNVLEIPAPTCE